MGGKHGQAHGKNDAAAARPVKISGSAG
jgi:hypothetical protein